MNTLIPLEMKTWDRAEHFRHFTEVSPCMSTLTANIEITPLVYALKKEGISFYPAFLYCVSYIVNGREEFRLGKRKDGGAGVWDVLHPAHNVFHEDTETYTTICTLWTTDFRTFTERCREDMERVRGLCVPSLPIPPNSFCVSCLPWLTYSGLSVQYPPNAMPLTPMITWGKWREENERIYLPLTMQIHHAAADGFHMARFFEETEKMAAGLAKRL